MSGPEQIWIEHHEAKEIGGSPEWLCLRATTNPNRPRDVEYIRADRHRAEVEAAVRRALEAAGQIAIDAHKENERQKSIYAYPNCTSAEMIAAEIRALLDPAALAAIIDGGKG
jgi:hypothetical protein